MYIDRLSMLLILMPEYKNICINPMKKIYFVFLLAFIAVFPAKSEPLENNRHKFSFGVSAGFLAGNSEEIVFKDDTKDYLSQ